MSRMGGKKRRKKRKVAWVREGELRAVGVRPRKAVTIPLGWMYGVIGLFLLGPAWVSTETFFTCLRHATLHHRFWANEEVYFFGLGVVMWVIAFFGLPRPLLVYVFGHELTHALWVWVMGGRVSEFRVARDGGYIVTDRHNFWIALTPYFFPLYSIAVVLAYGAASLHWNVEPYHRWLYAALGATWAFHVSFTLWMIPKGQTDLTYYGTFFSLVVIYLMNLAVLSVLLVVASPHVTWRGFGMEWVRYAHEFAHWVVGWGWVVWRRLLGTR